MKKIIMAFVIFLLTMIHLKCPETVYCYDLRVQNNRSNEITVKWQPNGESERTILVAANQQEKISLFTCGNMNAGDEESLSDMVIYIYILESGTKIVEYVGNALNSIAKNSNTEFNLVVN